MYNIFGYILYLAITFYIILFIGFKLYHLGAIYLKHYIQDTSICESINRILLIGYYLVNLGFCALTLHQWNALDTYTLLLEVLAYKIGLILLVLGTLHFFNIIFISVLSKNKSINYNNYGNKF